jgi:hypothetical protein
MPSCSKANSHLLTGGKKKGGSIASSSVDKLVSDSSYDMMDSRFTNSFRATTCKGGKSVHAGGKRKGKSGGSIASDAVMRNVKLVGGSQASDAVMRAVPEAGYHMLTRNATNAFTTKGGNALANYKMFYQTAGSEKTDNSWLPMTNPIRSGTSWDYSDMPNGVLASVSQPLSTVTPMNGSVVYPSYMQQFSPLLKAGGGYVVKTKLMNKK